MLLLAECGGSHKGKLFVLTLSTSYGEAAELGRSRIEVNRLTSGRHDVPSQLDHFGVLLTLGPSVDAHALFIFGKERRA